MSGIAASHLSMCYRVPVREASLRDALGSLWHRRYRQIEAVNDISFAIEPGEVVGFIGPNGAGKTTTLKMLSGILHPSSGTVAVHGFTPWRREGAFLRSIALIRGSQPLGGPTELTVLDALRFQQTIYEVSAVDFRKNLAELTELLDLGQLLSRQVRALSLGERMRCGLALALLYRPRVLFLDEPTLGLDVSAVNLIRRFIASYCRHTGATVLLTSHYMVDVETLCKRIILIDKGSIQFDGALSELSARLAPSKLLRVSFSDGHKRNWYDYGELVEADENSAVLSVRRELVPAVTARLLSEMDVTDLAVEEPPLERVIDQGLQGGGTMRRLLTLLLTATWRQILQWLAWRSFLLTIAINQAVAPLLGLTIWSVALPGSPAISTYYIALLVCQLLTVSYEQHTFSNGIYAGELSHDLLRPQPVVLGPLGANIALRLWHFVVGVPLILLLELLTHAHFALVDILLALPALLLAAVLRFLFSYLLSLSAFWTEQAHGVVGFGETLLFLLGGSAIPIPLFPASLRSLGEALPFRAMLGFPAEIVADRLAPQTLLLGYCWQLLWLLVFLPLVILAWRTGVRRYTAIGG